MSERKDEVFNRLCALDDSKHRQLFNNVFGYLMDRLYTPDILSAIEKFLPRYEHG